MIIEWNAHMFSTDTKRYPFHDKATYIPKPESQSSHPLDEYIARMKKYEIDRAVLVHPEPYGDDHTLALDCVAERPDLFKTTALFYPKDPHAPDKLRTLVKNNQEAIVAFRFHAHEEQRTYLESFKDANVEELWKTAGDLGLVIELHIGSEYAAEASELASKYSEFTVLVDHMSEAKYGSGPEYSDVIRMSELENVYMKLSGLNHYAEDAPFFESVAPFSRWVADAFGADRVVWGSGDPAIVDVHLEHWSEADRAKVKGDNLQKLLNF